MKFHYMIWDGKLVPDIKESESRKQYLACAKNGTMLVLQEQTPEAEIRTSQANRYLWGYVYPSFCPDNFDTPQAAHEHFTAEFLIQNEVVDLTEESLQKFTERLLKQSSQTHKPKFDFGMCAEVGDTVKITWVRSTASLTKKQFLDYTNKVIDFGASLGIQFLPPEQVDLTKIGE